MFNFLFEKWLAKDLLNDFYCFLTSLFVENDLFLILSPLFGAQLTFYFIFKSF